MGASLFGDVSTIVKPNVLTNIAALRGISSSANISCFVLGYYAMGDGGGGPYYYDANDITSADNGGTIIVVADGGRWKLVFTDLVSIKQFGAVADWNGQTGVSATGTDNSPFITAAIAAMRGKRLLAPKGQYLVNLVTTINSLVSGSAIGIEFFGEGYDANGGIGGTSFYMATLNTDLLRVTNTGSVDTPIRIHDMGIYGNPLSTSGIGVHVTNCANVQLYNLWVQNHGNTGIFEFQCYGGFIHDVYVFQNRLFGLNIQQAYNLGDIRNIKAYQNGKVWNQATANISITGSGNQNLGVKIQADFSYSGASIPWLRRSDATLTSITVAGGVATAVAPAHGRTTNDVIFVTGATVSTGLNSVFSGTITVVDANTFTFSAGGANGTYTESTLRIAPYSVGLILSDTYGVEIKGQSEDCAGPACYVGSTATGFVFTGGYYQGIAGSGLIVIDDASQGEVGAIRLNGANAALVHNISNQRAHGVNIKSSISLANSAYITFPTIRMVDGVYYADAAPTTGSWPGDPTVRQIRKLTPTVGQPKMGYFQIVVGSPGTWIADAVNL